MPESSSAGPRSTVFLIEDDPAVRKSLSWLIQSVGLPVEEYASANEYLTAVGDSRPGCVVADIRLPHLSGIELLERIRAQTCPCPVILITGHADVPLAVRALRAGAFDFLEKPCNEQALLDRVQQAIQRDQSDRAQWAERQAALARIDTLSAREREVFLLVLGGLANKEIAGRLGLSIKTVETHRARVCQKLECDHLAGLVHLANIAGLDLGAVAE